MLAKFSRWVIQRFSCLVLVLGIAAFAMAQKGSSPNQPRPIQSSPGTSPFDERALTIRNPGDFPPKKTEQTTCFLPPLDGVGNPTVGMAALEVQSKAKGEYEKVCSALREKKFDQAEKNLRKSTEKYPTYSVLWVLLAQVLENRQEFQQAVEDCNHASVADAAYVPAYLCLADIAARNGNWSEVLKQSDRALELDPSSNRVAYLFNSAAKFNLHLLKPAEDIVLKGIEIDKSHPDPRMHYLLAQIYEAKGDRANEEIQLRLCLKLSAGAKDAEKIRQYLSRLENTPASSLAP